MCSLESHWYRTSPLAIVLFPVSLLFWFVIAIRRSLYRFGILRSTRIQVPVIIVGNITVGGTGKTPLVIWLVEFLRERNFTPGVISRGYGGTSENPRVANADSDPALVGDEPVLIAKRCGCLVWVGRNRSEVAKALLQANPRCDILISDDGLQHYALARDLEIVVIDGARGFGNRMMLPAGPLREPLSRLQSVDAVVVNQGKSIAGVTNPYSMELVGDDFHNVLNPEVHASVAELKNCRLGAIAAIGNPQRFFKQLHAMGLTFAARVFPDHHRFEVQDLAFPDTDTVLMTEKDAVKCTNFANETHWALPVTAQIDDAFGNLILSKIGASRGP